MADALIRLPWGVITTVLFAAVTVGGVIAKVSMLSEENANMQKTIKALEERVSANEMDSQIFKFRLDQMTTSIGNSQ